MPATITLNTISALAILVQLCIFLYLYLSDSNRVRFFRYLLWAWGCFAVVKGAELTYRLYPGFAGSMLLMHAASTTWSYRPCLAILGPSTPCPSMSPLSLATS
jgi:hypothetical protein